jgi:hypothetical protein
MKDKAAVGVQDLANLIGGVSADEILRLPKDEQILLIEGKLTRCKQARYYNDKAFASVAAWLQKVTSGYYQYHAVPGNLPRLQLFRWRLSWVWWRALSRRSQRGRISLDRLSQLMDRWLPVPRVLHPYPMQRFNATHPRREPDA